MDKHVFSETVPNELKELGYVPPIIKPYNKDGVHVWLDKRTSPETWQLDIDGRQWMTLDQKHGQTSQFYPHYYLANGHVICTGLGFGIREKCLGTKPELRTLTVLVKFIEVI